MHHVNFWMNPPGFGMSLPFDDFTVNLPVLRKGFVKFSRVIYGVRCTRVGMLVVWGVLGFGEGQVGGCGDFVG